MKKNVITLLCTVAIAIVYFAMPFAMAAPLTSKQQIVVFHADQGKTFAVGKDLFTFKGFTSLSQDTPKLSAVEITNAPRSNPGGFLFERHVVSFPEDFYVLDGEFEFLNPPPSKAIKVNAGDIVHIPAGVPYGYKNVGTQSGRVLLVTPSQNFEAFIAEIGNEVVDTGVILSNAAQPDMGKITSAAPKYGIKFLN